MIGSLARAAIGTVGSLALLVAARLWGLDEWIAWYLAGLLVGWLIWGRGRDARN